MASFKITCNKCGTEQDFSTEDPAYRSGELNVIDDWYFERGDKKITIKASDFIDPPEITIECQNPECKSII